MKAKITLSNIKGFVQAHYRKVLEEMDFLPEHIKEQAEWRLSLVKKKSPECYNNDKCIKCGCQVSAKVYEDGACEGNCYPKMMSKKDWELLKHCESVSKNLFGKDVIDYLQKDDKIILNQEGLKFDLYDKY